MCTLAHNIFMVYICTHQTKKINIEMTKETASAIISALEDTNFSRIFADAHDGVQPEDFEDNEQGYAIMFNIETEKLFMLGYATPENGWDKTAEQQNPWIRVGFVSAETIIAGDPAYQIEQNVEMMSQEY